MIVNIEFLDVEPIENVVTCLNYKMDKVVFFGYEDVVAQKKDATERFLKRYCNVLEVEFHILSETNLDEVLHAMNAVIEKETEASNNVFFDVTGGEGLMLLAFGILSREKSLPMHMFDIEKGWLYQLNSQVKPTISEVAKKQSVDLDIDKYIEMYGGVVNHAMHKDTKSLDNLEFATDAKNMWNICSKYKKTWNIFSEFLREYCQPNGNMEVTMDLAKIRGELNTRRKFKKKDIENIFKECAQIGVFENLTSDGAFCTFKYKSAKIQDQLWDAGSVLELHTYMEEEPNSNDCRVGVHIDWDGTIHGGWGRDTVNEVDVLSLRGYIPTFISCKNGNVDQMALYELETVARRFGGKYAKMVLVAPQGMNKPHRIRAREMNIEVR